MLEETKNLTNENGDNYIDKYLDGLLSEVEIDAFEARCLDDKDFFHKVAERVQLREKVSRVIKKNGEQIFAAYAEQPSKRKAEKPAETIIGKIIGWWTNAKPIWKFAVVPVAVAVVLFMLILPRTEESFKKKSELENELGMRSYRNEGLEILSPKKGEVFEDIVMFTWQTDSKGPFELQILNNKAEVVASTRTTGTAYTVEGLLAPGLYYWKLFDAEYPVYVGKFYIKRSPVGKPTG